MCRVAPCVPARLRGSAIVFWTPSGYTLFRCTRTGDRREDELSKKNEKKGEYIPTHEDILKENGYLGKEEFCKCQDSPGTTTGFEDDFGYWDVCLKCGKRIEDGFHYYNHYDGEDHDDIDIW